MAQHHLLFEAFICVTSMCRIDPLPHFSGYTPADLEACATEVHRVYKANAAKIIKAVFEKFAADKWHCVALLPVPDVMFAE